MRIVVATPPMFIVVAVALANRNVVWLVVIPVAALTATVPVEVTVPATTAAANTLPVVLIYTAPPDDV